MRYLTVLRVSLGLAVALAVLRLLAPTPLEVIDVKALDYRHVFRGPIPPGGEVVIVGIDETSLAEIGRWPWPRSQLAQLIDGLSEADVATIGLDIILDQPDNTVDIGTLRDAVAAQPTRQAKDLLAALGPGISGDSQLAAALSRSGNVVLGHFFELGDETSVTRADDADRFPELSIRATGGATPESVTALKVARSLHGSVPTLAAVAAGAGHLNVLPDVDGVNRRIPLAIRVGDRLAPALSLELVRQYLGGEAATVTLAPREVREIRIGGITVPVGAGSQLWVNYLGPPSTFRQVSAADVIRRRVTPGELAGRIAIIGFTAPGFDEIATPFHPVGPGVQLQATVVDNILHGRGLIRPRWLVAVEALIIVVLGLAVGVVLHRLPRVVGWITALGIAGLYAWGTQYLFETRGLVLSAIYPIAAVLWCTLGTAVFQAVVEEREKRKIRDAFRHYLNAEVTDLLARDPSKLSLGGERREITVFFSDIRNFTTTAERLPPEALGKLLNEYLGAMTDIVFRHEGLLDKYIGDAIMAFWGAPMAVPDHGRRCCLAALDMREALAALHEDWAASGMPLLEIRIGINSGEAVVGNFGSAQRFSYTAVGDDVNLASRLEGLNKEYGTNVLITETTRRAIGDEFVCREIDRVVKGRVEPVTVYELLGRAASDEDGELRRLAEGFGVARAAYRAREWAEAISCLEALALSYPGDDAIRRFLARCHESSDSKG